MDCYRKTGRGRSYFDQSAELTHIRKDCPEFSRFSWMMQAFVLKKLHLAYEAFFKRAGFPRFKGKNWYKTIGWAKAEGWRVRDGYFVTKGIGAVRVHMHRPLPSKPLSCTVKREGRHWFVSFACEVDCSAYNDNPAVGIDLGITALAALSDGKMIRNLRASRRHRSEIRRRARQLSRCKVGSRNRNKVRDALRRAHLKIYRQRDAHLHSVSSRLVKSYGLIAIEALNVKGLAASMLSKSVNDAAWGKLIHMLRYKAAIAGSELIEVDPNHTSQTCPECGSIKAKDLSERVHNCPCGCVLDRDVAAAKVVLQRAICGPREAKVGEHVKPSRRKAVAAMPFANISGGARW